jgi:hypothetical protein
VKGTFKVLFLVIAALAIFVSFQTKISAAPTRPLVTEAPELAPVASAIAGWDLTVLCYVHDEPNDPWAYGAWAYVQLMLPVVHLSKETCDGARAVVNGDVSVPLHLQGLGVLALVHEAYHLKISLPLWRRQHEGQTECRAVKRVPQALLELGADQELADAILPWALASHYKITALDKDYDWPSCKVPVFRDFWP